MHSRTNSRALRNATCHTQEYCLLLANGINNLTTNPQNADYVPNRFLISTLYPLFYSCATFQSFPAPDIIPTTRWNAIAFTGQLSSNVATINKIPVLATASFLLNVFRLFWAGNVKEVEVDLLCGGYGSRMGEQEVSLLYFLQKNIVDNINVGKKNPHSKSEDHRTRRNLSALSET